MADRAVLIDLECTVCGFKGKVPDSFAGKQIRCRECSSKFNVPPLPGSTSAGGPATATVAEKSSGNSTQVQTIAVQCSKCGFKSVVPESFTGKLVKCRECSTQFRVNGPERQRSAAETVAELPEGNSTQVAGVEIDCTLCGFKFKVPESFLGKEVTCRQCGSHFQAGGRKQATNAATQPATQPVEPSKPDKGQPSSSSSAILPAPGKPAPKVVASPSRPEFDLSKLRKPPRSPVQIVMLVIGGLVLVGVVIFLVSNRSVDPDEAPLQPGVGSDGKRESPLAKSSADQETKANPNPATLPQPTLQYWQKMLYSEDAAERSNAARALRNMGQAGYPLLVEGIRSPKPEVQEISLQAMYGTEIINNKDEIFPLLLKLLDNDNLRVRRAAASRLEEYGVIGAKYLTAGEIDLAVGRLRKIADNTKEDIGLRQAALRSALVLKGSQQGNIQLKEQLKPADPDEDP